ncbi:hypothetical protein F8M41_014831 [Gigaspora margarita]|uniref:Uncharacterized protein n=1 Tax=Gigaspora margarita TaxID=4874 RepID=A0A8H4ARC7_GIGMA|nr:hypothetical protein F8M41_014831 [Gigaspora margarita]
MGTVIDSKEAIRCEYITTILHTCIRIVKKLTGKEITLNLQLEVVGEESRGRVDYAIKCIEELIAITERKQHQIAIVIQCESAYQTNKRKRKSDGAFGEDYNYLYRIITTATDWYFLLYTLESISCMSEIEYHISLTKAMAKEENETELHKNVKRVMEVIVGLLKDRADVEKKLKKKS